jgi:hypothetical protein
MGHKAYLEAVEGAFGRDIDYAMLVKICSACTSARKAKIEGNPDFKFVSTSYVERNNLTIRMHSKPRMSPAMAAGVSGRLWEVIDIVKLVEDAEATAKKRGPYQKAS